MKKNEYNNHKHKDSCSVILNNINSSSNNDVLDTTNSNNKINENNSKNKFHYFLPWKRAEADPSIVKIGTEIHLNPLPYNITYEDLFSLFKNYGEIIDIKIIPRKEIRSCFGLLRFLEIESAKILLKEKQILFKGSPIIISKSKEETTIFIGNINKSWSKEYFENILHRRVGNFGQLRYLTDINNHRENRGFCFLKFNNPLLARIAYKELSKNILLDGRTITVDWADDFSEKDINKTQIHISGINDSITTDYLYNIFSKYGDIMNIKLSRDLEGKDRNDYGFITYFNEEDASRVLDEFEWKKYFEDPLQVQYARKISSIIKHKQKIQGDMLERKRRRDNQIKNQINYDASDSDNKPEKQNNDKIINKFATLMRSIDSNNQINLGDLINNMSSFVSKYLQDKNQDTNTTK